MVVNRGTPVHGLGVTHLNQLKAGDRVLVSGVKMPGQTEVTAEEVRVLSMAEPLDGEQ